jgi:hypothetical protein
MKIVEQIHIICQEFANGLVRILGGKLHTAYIYGAAAFPDTLPTGDIDFHVILNTDLTSAEKRALEAFHEELGGAYPPLGGELDGYYFTLEDARKRTPPQSQMWTCATDNAWALHRAHIHAGRYLSLHGADPRGIVPPASWHELEEALRSELAYIRDHLHQYPDYCILNLCRLVYSFETREVIISKAQASEWALDGLPKWVGLVELARKSYLGQATPTDRERMLAEVRDFYEYTRERIKIL